MSTWRWIAAGIAVAAALFVAVGCGGEEPAAAPSEPKAKPVRAERVTVELHAENGSGQTGTATLTAVDEKTLKVVLEITPSKEHAYHPAHIHTGTCAEYRNLKTFDEQLATVSDELENTMDWRSESTLQLTRLEERTTGGYSINVHEPVGAYAVVACGDIPKR